MVPDDSAAPARAPTAAEHRFGLSANEQRRLAVTLAGIDAMIGTPSNARARALRDDVLSAQRALHARDNDMAFPHARLPALLATPEDASAVQERIRFNPDFHSTLGAALKKDVERLREFTTVHLPGLSERHPLRKELATIATRADQLLATPRAGDARALKGLHERMARWAGQANHHALQVARLDHLEREGAVMEATVSILLRQKVTDPDTARSLDDSVAVVSEQHRLALRAWAGHAPEAADKALAIAYKRLHEGCEQLVGLGFKTAMPPFVHEMPALRVNPPGAPPDLDAIASSGARHSPPAPEPATSHSPRRWLSRAGAEGARLCHRLRDAFCAGDSAPKPLSGTMSPVPCTESVLAAGRRQLIDAVAQVVARDLPGLPKDCALGRSMEALVQGSRPGTRVPPRSVEGNAYDDIVALAERLLPCIELWAFCQGIEKAISILERERIPQDGDTPGLARWRRHSLGDRIAHLQVDLAACLAAIGNEEHQLAWSRLDSLTGQLQQLDIDLTPFGQPVDGRLIKHLPPPADPTPRSSAARSMAHRAEWLRVSPTDQLRPQWESLAARQEALARQALILERLRLPDYTQRVGALLHASNRLIGIATKSMAPFKRSHLPPDGTPDRALSPAASSAAPARRIRRDAPA
ncbi:hypothetical protein [Roseateles aquatilis]|nr:hypothetical protein [Roseateles aquatilis]